MMEKCNNLIKLTIMEKVSYHNLFQRLAIALIAVCSLFCMTSCDNDDEPKVMTVNYYLSVLSKYPIYRRGGLPPAPKEDMIGKITTQMRTCIEEVYPNPDTLGNDYAVLVRCDELYRQYLESGYKANTECKVVLYRAKMSGTIVRNSKPLKTYFF